MDDVAGVHLGYGEKMGLLRLVRGQKTEHRLVVRAWIVWLRFVERRSVSATARTLGVTRPTVRQWAVRYASSRMLESLEDRHRSGRPAAIQTRHQAVVLSLACRRPEELGRLEARMTQAVIVEEAGLQGVVMSRSSVQRILAGAEVQPHKEPSTTVLVLSGPEGCRLSGSRPASGWVLGAAEEGRRVRIGAER